MPQVLLVNPSDRPSKRKAAATKVGKKGTAKMAKKPRTAAQKRATAKLVALNKARRAGRKSVKRTSNPERRRRSSSTSSRKTTRRVRRPNPVVETVMSNPSRKRRARRTTKRAASSAGKTLRYRRRRNPIGGDLKDFVNSQLIPSAIGGGGALLLDVALAVLPIPATLKTGALAPVVRIAGAVGVGMLAGAVTNRRTANQIAAGALTVTMYQIARGFLAKALPPGSVPGLADYPNYATYYGEPVGEYVEGYEDGVGEYVSDAPELGYTSSGMMVGDADDGMGEYVEGYETGVYR